MEFYRLKEDSKPIEGGNDEKYEKSIIRRINEKRDKKYFLCEPE